MDYAQYGKEKILGQWKGFYLIERVWNAPSMRVQAVNIDGKSLGFFKTEKDAKRRIDAYEKNGW
jgi:hypothetical protein